MKKIYIKKLVKAGYIIHNIMGNCDVGWNKLDLLAAFVYCFISIADSINNIYLILAPNLSQETVVIESPFWEAVLDVAVLASKELLQPVIIMNFILVFRVAVKLRMRNKAIREKGFLVLHGEQTSSERFSSPVDLRFRSLKCGIKVFLFVAIVLAVFLFTNKKMYFYVLPYCATIIAGILIFKDEFLENLIRRYNAEEHIYKRECIY